MALFIVLLLLAVLFLGFGFAAKWLFILAVIFAILAAVSYFSGNRGTRL